MVADIGAAGGYRASASSRRVARRASGGRCRAWRTRRRRPSGIAFGTNEPIANQTSRFDCDSSTQIIDICGLSDPGTVGQGSRFIERGWELTGVVSYEEPDKNDRQCELQEPDKEIRRRYHRGRNDSGYECVRALLRRLLRGPSPIPPRQWVSRRHLDRSTIPQCKPDHSEWDRERPECPRRLKSR